MSELSIHSKSASVPLNRLVEVLSKRIPDLADAMNGKLLLIHTGKVVGGDGGRSYNKVRLGLPDMTAQQFEEFLPFFKVFGALLEEYLGSEFELEIRIQTSDGERIYEIK